MIENQSVLPIYRSPAEQHHRKWYAKGMIPEIYAQTGYFPTFQFIKTEGLGGSITVELYDFKTGSASDVTSQVTAAGMSIDDTYDYEIVIHKSTLPVDLTLSAGAYYLHFIDDDSNEWWSEVFVMTDRIFDLIKIEYWHLEDFCFSQDGNGVNQFIRYQAPFRNLFFCDSDIAKPQYQYERDRSTRLSTNLDKVHTTYKTYRFVFPAVEEVIDALRHLPLHDQCRITYKGKIYIANEVQIIPEWEEHGDMMNVEVLFRTGTATVVAGRALGNTTYEPDAGSCLTVDYVAVAIVENGSAEYLAYQYTDGDGETQDLEDGDYIVLKTGGNHRLQRYSGVGYVEVVEVNEEVIYVEAVDEYWRSLGSNSVARPGPEFYSDPFLAGVSLPGAQHLIYAIVGTDEIFLGTFDDLNQSIDLPEGAESIRVDFGSATCGVFQSGSYDIPDDGGGDEGIGSDAIGFAAIGED